MPLATGTRLGPYEVVEPVGAGGMGEVYRARDTRLDRSVAIKVLPPHLAGNLELKQRLEREARAVSSLNHPHICTLYDIGQHEGADFLVMEYLEGETLAKRLERGPLALEQALRCGVEIADALEKAHRQGVTHRDLKPGNIMLTKTGAKLLDFGLAKAAPAAAASLMTAMPTQDSPLTAQGTIVGTFQYMAPEQLEGKEADARSDIFALGAVLYEMAAGRKAFEGKNQTSVIAAILASDPPPLLQLAPMTPPALERVVKTCLAKDPEERWQTAHDLKLQLQWIAEGGSQVGLAPVVTGRRKRQFQAAWAAAGVSLAASLIMAVILVLRAGLPQAPAVRAFIAPPKDYTFGPWQLAISPDGAKLAFRGWKDGVASLWVQSLATGTAQQIPDSPDAVLPFWSPDSKYLGFCAKGKLQKTDAGGGPIITLVEDKGCAGGTWSREGIILFRAREAILQVPAGGGQTTEMIRDDKSSRARSPFFLPNGRRFLFYQDNISSAGSTPQQAGIYLGDLKTRERSFLLAADSPAQYAEPDFLLYVRQNTLMAQSFNAAKLALIGDPVPISPINGAFAASGAGLLAYFAGAGANISELLWYSRDGKQVGSVGERAEYGPLRISPDGRRLAMEIYTHQAKTDIWVHELARGSSVRVTFEKAWQGVPVWARDGKRILFAYADDGPNNLHVKLATGLGQEESLLPSKSNMVATDWSADGRYIAYMEFTGGLPHIGILQLEPEKKADLLLRTNFAETAPRFSPDSKWLAYSSNETGRPEIYVVPFPELTEKWKVSTDGGGQPIWRNDGKELFYVAPDARIMAVAVGRRGDVLEFGKPAVLLETRMVEIGSPFHQYDVTPDGQKFIVNSKVQTTTEPMTVTFNWTALLKK